MNKSSFDFRSALFSDIYISVHNANLLSKKYASRAQLAGRRSSKYKQLRFTDPTAINIVLLILEQCRESLRAID